MSVSTAGLTVTQRRCIARAERIGKAPCMTTGTRRQSNCTMVLATTSIRACRLLLSRRLLRDNGRSAIFYARQHARKILDPVLERIMEGVYHYEGTVNQVMGDGIMAPFGASLAHEPWSVGVGRTQRRDRVTGAVPFNCLADLLAVAQSVQAWLSRSSS